MTYILLTLLFFLLLLIYFKIADKFNIIDKPNERSSHTTVTLRGGGIIFYIGILAFFITSGCQYSYFFLGLSLMTIVSFADDIMTLSNKIRLSIHLLSVLLMAQQLQVFDMPWYYLIISFVVVIGVINAYNFMDGINGITAAYSLTVAGLLAIVNHQLQFIDQDIIIYTLLATAVFAYFNFRNHAKCFAGDVGSVAMAYILLFILASLIIYTQNLIYILFLAIYGIDTIWTIIRRLRKKENIFKAHRSHLYQYLGNEAGVNKLLISFVYGLLQFSIGLLVLAFANQDLITQIIFALSLLIGLSILYIILKSYVIKRYAEKS